MDKGKNCPRCGGEIKVRKLLLSWYPIRFKCPSCSVILRHKNFFDLNLLALAVLYFIGGLLVGIITPDFSWMPMELFGFTPEFSLQFTSVFMALLFSIPVILLTVAYWKTFYAFEVVDDAPGA